MHFKVSVQGSTEDIISKDDGQLFDLMRNVVNDELNARSAWNEFYRRYANYIWNCCARVCRTVTEGDNLAKDVFQSTINKVFIQAKTYRQDKATGIKSWLSRVVYNEFIDYYNKYHAHFISSEQISDDLKDFADDTSSEEIDESSQALVLLSIRKEQLKSLLSILSSREFKILMTYMNYYQIDKPNAHLPDNVMMELCNEFSLKSDTIRQIKRRALLKLQKHAAKI